MAQKRSRTKSSARSGQFDGAAEQASSAVRQAASVLEGELAVTLAGARKLERRFAQERRVDQGELDDVLGRVRADIHELIDVGAERLAELRSPDVVDVTQRLTVDAHDFFDMMIDMLTGAPELINGLLAATEAEGQVPKRATRRSGAAAKPRTRPSGRATGK
jgi:hypothetical protein